MSESLSVAALTEAVTHLTANNYYAVASFAMFVYDIILTFPQEVEKIWKRKFTGLTVLWFMNRWVYLLAVIVVYDGYLDSRWTTSICNKLFRLPGLSNTFQRLTIGTVFTLRTYCIYHRNFKVASIVGFFVAVEISVKLTVLFLYGEPVTLPPGITGCILAVAPQNANKFSAFWITELATDIAVLACTLFRSYQVYWKSTTRNNRLWKIILKDGIIYFSIIFTANIANVIMFVTLAQDLKALNANFGSLCTSLLVSRLILNLKVAAGSSMNNRLSNSYGGQSRLEWKILGNIGNDLEGTISQKTSVSVPRYTREEFELKEALRYPV